MKKEDSWLDKAGLISELDAFMESLNQWPEVHKMPD